MRIPILLASAVGFLTASASAQKPTPAGIRFFETKIRPVRVKHCYECHSRESGKSKGGLRLDSRAAVLTGGENGPAIVPRSPEKSRLLKAIGYADADLQMPPKGKLPAAVIEDFRRWIAMGAPDPRRHARELTVQKKIDIKAGRKYWAYQKPIKPASPKVKDTAWPRTEIDRHLLAGMEKKQLRPVRDADARTLVRRLYVVLTGLPPSPEQQQLSTKRIEGPTGKQLVQREVARLVDELLKSPRFGERWGRHWLDVARFAESTGGDHNNIYRHAWRYRDYVIDAFNADKPFDRFILEQLAGDLLPIANDKEWGNNLVATGFLAIGVKLVGEENQRKFFADVVDEQIDTTTRAFLGTTVACARCHDHKFDPIPQTDYYALAGIFRSTQTHYGLIKAQARQATTLIDITGLGLPSDRKKLNAEELAKLYKDRDDARKRITDYMSRIRSGNGVPRGLLRRARTLRDKAEAAVRAFDEQGNPRVFAMGTQDKELPLQTRVLHRGEVDQPREKVRRGVVQVINPSGAGRLSDRLRGSGRLQLARWIASKENPLTARVIANRVWHYLFGRGIVPPLMILERPARCRLTRNCSTIWRFGWSKTNGRSRN